MKTGPTPSPDEGLAYVLDTFALTAYLRDEPGALRIQTLIRDAEREQCRLYVSLIHLGEVCTLTEKGGGSPRVQEVLALLRQLPIKILPVDEQSVFATAHLKANHSLSDSEAFAITAARGLNAILITGDPEFAPVENLVQVERLKKSNKEKE